MSKTEKPPSATSATPPASKPGTSRGNRALHARANRFRTLAAVWKALKTSGLAASSMHLGDTGAELRDHLNAVARTGADSDSLSRIDEELDSFELSMRDVACNIPISTLRAKLPDAIQRDRTSVLELLDVMLVSDSEDPEGELGSRLSAVDYLITLLCTDGNEDSTSIQHDPVTLTPRLQLICQSADASGDANHSLAETDFYSAAQGAASGAPDTNELEKQKTELGNGFFAPRMLRAITTYNASRLAGAKARATAPPEAPPVAAAPPRAHNPSVSVFETTALLPLIESLRRRVTGVPQEATAVDRVAWCLDLDFATPSETAMMLESSGASPEKPLGAAILVGLLCRSIDVLGDELLAVGICPDVLSSEWATELSDAVKADVNQRILTDGYTEACALSDLRGKFLDFSGRTVPEGWRPEAPTAPPVDDKKEMRRAASNLATQALDAPAAPVFDRSDARTKEAVRTRLLQIVGVSAAVIALAAALLFQATAMPEGRVALSGGDLPLISEHLVSAQRDGNGGGPSFVGRLDNSWGELGAAERQASAADMVATLRLLGAQNIMIYDGARRVRIQALGEGNVLVPDVDAATN